jgi:hypothetical protein
VPPTTANKNQIIEKPINASFQEEIGLAPQPLPAPENLPRQLLPMIVGVHIQLWIQNITGTA